MEVEVEIWIKNKMKIEIKIEMKIDNVTIILSSIGWFAVVVCKAQFALAVD